MMYDMVIIGRGLTGTAAAKYLSLTQQKIAIIGPDESSALKEGIIFSSHYDQSRIQRIIGKDETWTRLNKQSAAEYEMLEKETQIYFHSNEGCLYVNPYGNDAYLEKVPQQGKQFGINYREFETGEEILSSFPDFNFPSISRGIYEGSPSGHINPRLLIKAQIAIFQKNGGEVFNETVKGISNANGEIKITTNTGKVFYSKKVLLTPGAFINFFDLTKRKLSLRLKSETTIWVKVKPEEATRLSKLPSLLYEIAEPDIQNIYLVRPIQYPDGEFYLKMGANLPADIFFNGLEEIQHWFKEGQSRNNLETLQNAIKKIMPHLQAEEFALQKCIVSFTDHGKPYIGTLDNGLYFIAGGNGYSAMCSDALGKIGSTLALENKFPLEFSKKEFEPVFAV